MTEIKLRKELQDVKRIVVKVGSNVIINSKGKCDLRRMRIIVEDICDLQEAGYEVVLVSSGAVSVGKAFIKKYLGEQEKKEGTQNDLQQSASSIGQPKLINRYSSLFEEHDKICSQILLTHDDFRNRDRFLNAKKTVKTLLKNHVIPILNENDTVSFSEITVGDNDHLAAAAAQMINADLMVLVTGAQGLYDRNPDEKDAQLLRYVEFDDELDHLDMDSSKSSSGRGGMRSKVDAVKKVTPLGIKAIISSQENDRIVLDPLVKEVGTFFGPKKHYDPEKRNAWMFSTKKTNCAIDICEKTMNDILDNKSLSPKGIVNIRGEFFKGDSVEICLNGICVALGISEYNHDEIENIRNIKTDELEKVLGFKVTSEIIKPQNIVINKG